MPAWKARPISASWFSKLADDLHAGQADFSLKFMAQDKITAPYS